MTGVEHPCGECGEPTLNDSLCRDCYIEEQLKAMECRHCGRQIMNDNARYLGLTPRDHADDCPLKCNWCDSRGCFACEARRAKGE